MTWRVVLGLIVFVGLVTLPVWYNGASDRADAVPNLVYPDTAAHGALCVASKDYMKHSHMELLNRWRDDVVRRGERVFEAADGRRFVMSLSRTCMGCHQNKSTFCDPCHDYLGVKPYCWECHVEPKESL